MRLVQEPAFSPIAIVLETADEAETLWAIVRHAEGHNQFERDMIRKLSDLFSNEAHL